MCTINTKRLALRRYTMDDVDDYYEFAKQPSVRDACMDPHIDITQAKKAVEIFSRDNEVWAIVHRVDDKVIGYVGLHETRKRIAPGCKSIEYAINQDYSGNGYCTEAVKGIIEYAFCELDLALVGACHYPHNIASKRVIEKYGMKFEGVIRRGSQLFDGTIYDDWNYSITKQEYEKSLIG